MNIWDTLLLFPKSEKVTSSMISDISCAQRVSSGKDVWPRGMSKPSSSKYFAAEIKEYFLSFYRKIKKQ